MTVLQIPSVFQHLKNVFLCRVALEVVCPILPWESDHRGLYRPLSLRGLLGHQRPSKQQNPSGSTAQLVMHWQGHNRAIL